MRPQICTLYSSSVLRINVSLFMSVIQCYFAMLHVLHLFHVYSCEQVQFEVISTVQTRGSFNGALCAAV